MDWSDCRAPVDTLAAVEEIITGQLTFDEVAID
ncbi:hypothetical protein RQN9TF_33655 (plasmid) [Rhodococcus qingshengii]|jgi:hypothetical protein|nr:hypothetical protein RQN9TF_33655 [Rhodococcus qingshengii]